MKIQFTIPDPEPINIEIYRNSFTGSFTCTANRKQHELKSPLAVGTHFAVDAKHDYTVEINEGTKHLIEIEHSRPRFFGGLLPNRYIVKLDGNLVADETGY